MLHHAAQSGPAISQATQDAAIPGHSAAIFHVLNESHSRGFDALEALSCNRHEPQHRSLRISGLTTSASRSVFLPSLGGLKPYFWRRFMSCFRMASYANSIASRLRSCDLYVCAHALRVTLYFFDGRQSTGDTSHGPGRMRLDGNCLCTTQRLATSRDGSLWITKRSPAQLFDDLRGTLQAGNTLQRVSLISSGRGWRTSYRKFRAS